MKEIEGIKDILKTSSRHNYECKLSTKDSVRLIRFINSLESQNKQLLETVESLKKDLTNSSREIESLTGSLAIKEIIINDAGI